MLDWLLEADMALKRSHSKEHRGRLVLEKLFVKMAKELGAASSGLIVAVCGISLREIAPDLM